MRVAAIFSTPPNFGANADAAGLATVNGPQIDVQFSSASGGIGQLAGLPVLVISVPVLASAAGRTVVISATSPDSSVSVASGSIKVQGTLSVEKIPAGTGVVAAGTVVPVYGTGFTASTTVTIDGALITPTNVLAGNHPHERLRPSHLFRVFATRDVAQSFTPERHHPRDSGGDLGSRGHLADLLAVAFHFRIDSD
jgi:hypothetical protein